MGNQEKRQCFSKFLGSAVVSTASVGVSPTESSDRPQPCFRERFRRRISLIAPQNKRTPLHLPLLHTLVEERVGVRRPLSRWRSMGTLQAPPHAVRLDLVGFGLISSHPSYASYSSPSAPHSGTSMKVSWRNTLTIRARRLVVPHHHSVTCLRRAAPRQ